MRHVGGLSLPIEDSGRLLAATGLLESEVHLPEAGDYELVVNAYADQAGSEPARMSVRIDGEEIRLLDVNATREDPAEHIISWNLPAGAHKVGLAFVNDYYRPDEPDPNRRDRNLAIISLELRRMEVAWDQLPLPHRQILLQPPTPSNRRKLAKEAIRRFAERAFRRPVSRDERRRILQIFQAAERDGATYEQAMKAAITAILVSPKFLFRIEIDEPRSGKYGMRALNDFELASRLSYFLWSSMPDDALFAAAQQGTLRKGDKLTKQVERMLDDAKASALVESFAVQWLQLRKLEIMTPDADRFAGFTNQLRADMRRETELFFAAVLQENRSIVDLLDADFTFLNERLARHYGINGVEGDKFHRVTVPREKRGGILTHASVLTLTSNPTRTSPVKRGKWVLENLLGAPPPPPPQGVPELPDEATVELTGTLRERMQQHRADQACSVCHNNIDPLGFGLENYDAVGRWRSHDKDALIDASGTLPDGSSFDGAGELKQLLVSRKDEFARCFSEKLLTYALGRGLAPSDRLAIDKIVAAAQQDDYKIRSIVLAVVLSEPFLKRSTENLP